MVYIAFEKPFLFTLKASIPKNSLIINKYIGIFFHLQILIVSVQSVACNSSKSTERNNTLVMICSIDNYLCQKNVHR